MRILFWGSGDFAVPSLRALVGAGFDLPLVVTQPDRPAGRGGAVRGTPIRDAAAELGIPVYQPPALNDPAVAGHIRAQEPDLCVIIAYGHLVTPELLAIPRFGFVNAHASILPKYRGAAPVPHAILHGERETGVTFFRLAERWDDGPVYEILRTPIGSNDTSATVLERLGTLAAEALPGLVRRIADGSVRPLPQSHEDATRAPKFTRDDGRVDWARPFAEIDCLVRALQPWPEAFTTVPTRKGAARVHLLEVEDAETFDHVAEGTLPGTVLAADGRDGIVVASGKGAVRLARLKPEGKKAMTGAEYARGAQLTPGTRLGE